MESLIEKLSRGQDILMYINSDTGVHDVCTTPAKGRVEWLGMVSFAIAGHSWFLMNPMSAPVRHATTEIYGYITTFFP